MIVIVHAAVDRLPGDVLVLVFALAEERLFPLGGRDLFVGLGVVERDVDHGKAIRVAAKNPRPAVVPAGQGRHVVFLRPAAADPFVRVGGKLRLDGDFFAFALEGAAAPCRPGRWLVEHGSASASWLATAAEPTLSSTSPTLTPAFSAGMFGVTRSIFTPLSAGISWMPSTTRRVAVGRHRPARAPSVTTNSIGLLSRVPATISRSPSRRLNSTSRKAARSATGDAVHRLQVIAGVECRPGRPANPVRRPPPAIRRHPARR